MAALHYLLKPVKEEKLFEVLDRAASRIRRNEKTVSVEVSGEMVLIPLHEELIRALAEKQKCLDMDLPDGLVEK